MPLIVMNILYLDCDGWVTLLSNRDSTEIQVEAEKLHEKMRNSNNKSIKKKIKRKGMHFAKVNGDCCWEVRDRYSGGESKELWRAHTYYLQWSIKSIKLIDC